ncbi:hypothetical protein D3C76_946340 [compost metagenome]|uniref:hypothetical protein n=1 Tax=Pseudomonas sp. 2,4-D TaxID=3058433 RepID=UPI000FB84496|nr:hypothetical protein [Pseudomonas sp. 2,4-D]MDN4511383.1 hypothetical protein [Pseudomonas sp. 2,4-D]
MIIDKEKLKALADRIVTDRRFCADEHHRELAAGVSSLLAEVEELKGLRPEWPPRPPDGEGLPRYGLRWNGPQQPLAVPMEDGYWTPWHLAERLREDRDGLLEAGDHLL